MRKPKPKGNSAVAYVRVSTGRQVDEGNSIDNHLSLELDQKMKIIIRNNKSFRTPIIHILTIG